MQIGELAEKTGLSLRTIRHYDEVGLLPAAARTDGGFRVYTPDDVERLMVIRRMKPLGFTLEEMADLLSIIESAEESEKSSAEESRRGRLVKYLKAASAQREKMRRNLQQADEFIATLQKY